MSHRRTRRSTSLATVVRSLHSARDWASDAQLTPSPLADFLFLHEQSVTEELEAEAVGSVSVTAVSASKVHLTSVPVSARKSSSL